MKLFRVKKALFSFLLVISFACLFSCQQVVLDSIRKEVELESGSIAGDIRSIVKFKDCYYIANGGIYYKHKDWLFYGSWVRGPAPDGHVIKLAADANYLYALVGISAENTKEGKNQGIRRDLYYSEDGISWKFVSEFCDKGSLVYSSKYIVYVYLFCTNTIDPTTRSAYVVLNDGLKGITNIAYELDGSRVTKMELGFEDASTKPFSNGVLVSRSCVYYNGDVYFFNSNASVTNETTLTPATMYYYGSGSYLHWGGEKENKKNPILCETTIQSLGVTADYLLVGTNAGIYHRPLTDKIPGILSVDFLTNAASTLSPAYTILSILVVYPELPETKTPIYASQVYTGNGSSNSAQFDHVGLWAYYPSRGNWNRE